jgi:hypothetical protein
MTYPFRIFRRSNTIKDYDAQHLEAVRAAIAHSKEVIENSYAADSFAGRKSQEPFPNEND